MSISQPPQRAAVVPGQAVRPEGPLPPPLPVRVRPAAGESVESYIRRLARANHLRPSLLQVYVRSPGVPTGAVRLPRLAAASGSTLAALTGTLTGLPPASGRHRPPPRESQAGRKTRLFRVIRDDAAQGMSIQLQPPSRAPPPSPPGTRHASRARAAQAGRPASPHHRSHPGRPGRACR